MGRGLQRTASSWCSQARASAQSRFTVAWRDGLMTEAHTLALACLRLGDGPAVLVAATLARAAIDPALATLRERLLAAPQGGALQRRIAALQELQRRAGTGEGGAAPQPARCRRAVAALSRPRGAR